MKKTHRGSCHCGAVRFEAELDLAAGTSRCNCSICLKSRFWKSVVPTAAFRLLDGDAALVDYTFGKGNIHHLFCRTCGVKPFGRGEHPEIGKFVAVNVACLDETGESELAATPIKFEDGKHDHWERPPEETRYL